MYCRKCGKEIKDNSKFCPYCGNEMSVAQSSPSVTDRPELNSDIGTHTTDEQEDPPTSEKKAASRPKWVVPVAVVSSVAVIGVVVFMGVRFMQKPSETTKQVTADIEKQEEKTSVSEEIEKSVESAEPEQPEYPVEITLDEEVKNKLIDFVHHLGNTDCKMCGGDGTNLGTNRIVQTYGTTYFGYAYLYMSLYKDVPFNNGQAVELSIGDFYTWKVSEEVVNNYLQNTINSIDYQMQFDEFSPYKVENGMVYFNGFDPNSMWNIETPTIDKIMAVSDNMIEVQGSIRYTYMKEKEEVDSYDILLKENPESMWGGYTLIEIKSWGQQDSQNITGTTGDYILSDIATRYYSENELSGMDANTLSLARNELYARHGYIFKTPELQEYFGGKSWYTPQVAEVPDSAFNVYEKANLELIQKLEANF